MMRKFSETLKKRHEEQEQRRIGDLYAECIRRGCEPLFPKSFETRMWFYPLKQTYSFFEMIERHPEDEWNREFLRQWKILLEVAKELRPDHQMADEWDRSLEEISSYQSKMVIK